MVTAVVDVSRAWPSTEESMIKDAREFMEDATASVIVCGFDHQRAALNGYEGRFESFGTTLPAAQIAERLALVLGELADCGPERVVLFSFHSEVLGKEGPLAQVPMEYEVQSLNTFVRKQAGAGTWPANYVDLDVAVDTLVRALRKHGHTSRGQATLKQTVRSYLMLEDQRFDKRSSPAAATQGLISILVSEAASRGVIVAEGKEPRVRVWTTQPATPAEAASQPVDERGDEPTRSGSFRSSLKEQGLGPFAGIRLKVYDAIEYLVNENSGVYSERMLIPRAVEKVRLEAPESFGTRRNGETLSKDEFPWKRLGDFIGKLLRLCPVLLGPDGNQFTPSWGTMGLSIHGLSSNWRLRLEAELVFALVERWDDLKYEDIEELAGALLGSRESEDQRKIQDILEFLMEDGRVAVDAATDSLRTVESSTEVSSPEE